MWRCVVGSVVPDVSKGRSDTKRFLQQREREEHLRSSIMVSACVSVTGSDVCVWTWPAGDRTISSWQQAGSDIKDVLHSCVFFKWPELWTDVSVLSLWRLVVHTTTIATGRSFSRKPISCQSLWITCFLQTAVFMWAVMRCLRWQCIYVFVRFDP
jgi:hypothetical protein